MFFLSFSSPWARVAGEQGEPLRDHRNGAWAWGDTPDGTGFHLMGYRGVFASRSKVRLRLVPQPPSADIEAAEVADRRLNAAVDAAGVAPDLSPRFPAPEPRERYLSWAELLRRTRGIDVLRSERCGGRVSVVGFVTDPDLAVEILEQLEGAPRGPAPPV